MMRLSIRSRILASFVAISTVLLLGFAGVTYVWVRRSLTLGVDADLRARAAALASLVEWERGRWDLEFDGAGGPPRDLVSDLRAWSISTYPDQILLLSEPSGTDDLGLTSLPPVPPTATLDDPTASPLPTGAFSTDERTGDRRFVGIYAVREEHAERGEPLAPRIEIVLVADRRPIFAALGSLKAAFGAIGIGTLLLSTGAGWLLARRIVEPLARISRDAEAIRGPGQNRPIRGSGAGDEIDRLAANLDGAFDRMHHAYDQQTRFTADAAHELRTPVATIRSQAEVALRRTRSEEEYSRVLTVIATQAVRLGDLLNALLLLARLDAVAPGVRPARLRLDKTVRDVIREFATQAEREHIALMLSADTPVEICAEPELVAIAVRNLVSNAIRHAARPGTVEIRVEADGERATVSVRDDGQGIAEADLVHVFERFYRADSSRDRETGAAGLGLSIVAAIARHHRGEISASSRTGEGSTFVLQFPVVGEATTS